MNWRTTHGSRFTSAALAVRFAHALTEKLTEQVASERPILLIYAIFHLWSFYLALNKSGFFQSGKVLRYGGLRNGQFLIYFTEIARLLMCQEIADSNSCGMPQGFREFCEQFLFDCIFCGCHIFLLLDYCSQIYELF